MYRKPALSAGGNLTDNLNVGTRIVDSNPTNNHNPTNNQLGQFIEYDTDKTTTQQPKTAGRTINGRFAPKPQPASPDAITLVAPRSKPKSPSVRRRTQPQPNPPPQQNPNPSPPQQQSQQPLEQPHKQVLTASDVDKLGYKFVYFTHKKGAKKEKIPMRIDVSNNVAESMEKLDNSNSLKCAAILECENLNGAQILAGIQQRFSADKDWTGLYAISKEDLASTLANYNSQGYPTTTLGRAKITKQELKKYSSQL